MSWYDMCSSVQAEAEDLAGNWRDFKCFIWSGKPKENAEDCAIIYLSHRDNEDHPITASNQATILRELKPWIGYIDDGDDVEEQSHSSWLVGHQNCIVIRCLKNGQPTDAFKKLHSLARKLSSYPILDESDVSDRECEDENKSWESYGAEEFQRELKKLAPFHDELIDSLDNSVLFCLWAELAPCGETCVHGDDGAYFPFRHYFNDRASWSEVRTKLLAILKRNRKYHKEESNGSQSQSV